MSTPDPANDRLRNILRCPRCHGTLQWHTATVICDICRAEFPCREGRPDFSGATTPETEDAHFQQERMHRRSLRGRLYDLGQRVITSEYAPVNHRAIFLDGTRPGDVIVELGSGNRRLLEGIINVDLFLFPNVDAAADIASSPFADATVDHVILDSVIEHVPDAQAVINEAHRILKPGGRLLCINPFLFPYHGYPAHYCNYSRDGVQRLLRDFTEVTVEPHYGPTSALINITSEYFGLAISGGRRTPHLIVRASVLLVIGWLRFLDRLFVRSATAHRLAGTLCAVAIK